MNKPKVDSVENYYQRFEFPGGVRLYPLGVLDQLAPLRQVNTRHGGTIKTKGFFTLKDLRKQYPEEKYWPTLVFYCLLQGYHTQVSFRHPAWEIRVHPKR